MKAIILAAGCGSRLNPLSKNTPKCLLKIDGVNRLIDFQVRPLIKNKIQDIVVVVGFRSEQIINYLKRKYPRANFMFIHNPDFLNTGAAYSMWLAQRHLTGPFLYLNSDVLCDPLIIKKIISHPKSSATAFQKIPWNKEAVNIVTDEKNEITEIGKHISPQNSTGEFIGVTKIGKIFAKHLMGSLEYLIKNDAKKAFCVDAINLAIKTHRSKMFALDISDLAAIEIDYPKDLRRARRDIAPKLI